MTKARELLRRASLREISTPCDGLFGGRGMDAAQQGALCLGAVHRAPQRAESGIGKYQGGAPWPRLSSPVAEGLTGEDVC